MLGTKHFCGIAKFVRCSLSALDCPTIDGSVCGIIEYIWWYPISLRAKALKLYQLNQLIGKTCTYIVRINCIENCTEFESEKACN